jgi:hypothetical protein
MGPELFGLFFSADRRPCGHARPSLPSSGCLSRAHLREGGKGERKTALVAQDYGHGGLPDSMPIGLFNFGKLKTLADLAIVSLGCLFLQIGAPAGARGPAAHICEKGGEGERKTEVVAQDSLPSFRTSARRGGGERKTVSEQSRSIGCACKAVRWVRERGRSGLDRGAGRVAA